MTRAGRPPGPTDPEQLLREMEGSMRFRDNMRRIGGVRIDPGPACNPSLMAQALQAMECVAVLTDRRARTDWFHRHTDHVEQERRMARLKIDLERARDVRRLLVEALAG